jgi:uncharacterized protein
VIYNLAVLICGIIFGCGLTISNMINPNKVLNFLDITGNWDPSLALVMLSAVIVTWVGYKFVLTRSRPILTNKFYLPHKTKIDFRLVLGAALFGIGWGISGYCPGPGMTAIVLGSMDPIYFLIGLVLSMCLHQIIAIVFRQRPSERSH